MAVFGRLFGCGVVTVLVLGPTLGCDQTGTVFSSTGGSGGAVNVAPSTAGNDNGSETGNTVTDPPIANGSGDVLSPAPPAPPTNGVVPSTLDSDGDGFSDEEEITALPGSDPQNPNDTPVNPIDSDGDGCSDFDERTFVGFCDGNPNTIDPNTLSDPGTAHTFSLTVARHADVSFSDAQVDAVFSTGGALLQQVDTECPDLATNTTFVRQGSVTTFTAGGSILTVESQLSSVFDVPQDVKIVDLMVGVCGVPQLGDLSVVLGCSFTGGSLVITATAAPDVWVHEWGHVQGLLHRDDCPRNIMHSFEVETNAVNAEERAAFLTPTPRMGKVAAPASPTRQNSSGRLRRYADEPTRDWIGRLVTKEFVAGVPTELMQDLENDATDPLLEMLWDPDFDGQRRNVARMLGFTAAPRACASLMTWIPALSGDLTFDEMAAVCESILAIGRLSADGSDDAALGWLMEGCDPAVWSQRGVEWRYRSNRGAAVHRLLARMSIMALGLSAQPAALNHLQSLNIEGFGAQIDDAIAQLTGQGSVARRSVHPMKQP